MRKAMMLITFVLALSSVPARGEFMEIGASEIAAVETTGGENPTILVRWDLPIALDSVIIDAATISMQVPLEGKDPLEVNLHPVLKSWSAATTFTAGDLAGSGGFYDDAEALPAVTTGGESGTITVDVYSQVLDQLAGESENFGFILIPQSDGDAKVKSLETGASSVVASAKLIIAYRLPLKE